MAFGDRETGQRDHRSDLRETRKIADSRNEADCAYPAYSIDAMQELGQLAKLLIILDMSFDLLLDLFQLFDPHGQALLYLCPGDLHQARRG